MVLRWPGFAIALLLGARLGSNLPSLELALEFPDNPITSITSSLPSLDLAARAGSAAEDLGGDHGDDDHGGDSEGDEHVNEAVAWMLLGTVAFVLLLFYFVNFRDEDIRLYSWRIISVTASIFTAVLVFNGINTCLVAAVCGEECEERPTIWAVLLQYAHFAFWVSVLQVLLGYLSGGLFEGPEGREKIDKWSWTVADSMRHDFETAVEDSCVQFHNQPEIWKSIATIKGVQVPVVKRRRELDRRKRNMKCWGMILGHMAAFADMRAGNDLQMLPFFSGSPWLALLPIGINLVAVWGLYEIFDYFRESKRKQDHQRGLGKRIHMFDEEAEETENEVISLSTSFMLVKVAKFAVTGQHSQLDEMESFPNSISSVYWMLGLAVLAVFIMVLLSLLVKCEEEEEEEGTFVSPVQDSNTASEHSLLSGHAWKERLARYGAVATCTSAMVFAWAFRAASIWGMHFIPWLKGDLAITTMGGNVIHALTLSLLATLAILALDKFDDWQQARGMSELKLGMIVNSIVEAIGILVGLSWERAFDTAVEEVVPEDSSKLKDDSLRLAFVLGIALIIVPAWRWYILSKALQLEKYRKEQRTAERDPHTMLHAGSQTALSGD